MPHLPSTNDILVASTAVAAVGGYAVRVLIDVVGLGSNPAADADQETTTPETRTPRSLKWKRIAWTFGFVACVCHVLMAFAFHHHWSHSAALEHTAKQTAAVTGIDWGGGVYFNYIFLAGWGFDVGLAWFRSDWWQNAKRYQFAMHVTFAFMMFNATVVFGPVHWTYIGTVYCFAILILLGVRRRRAPSRAR